jgi:hypothetical protein
MLGWCCFLKIPAFLKLRREDHEFKVTYVVWPYPPKQPKANKKKEERMKGRKEGKGKEKKRREKEIEKRKRKRKER